MRELLRVFVVAWIACLIMWGVVALLLSTVYR